MNPSTLVGLSVVMYKGKSAIGLITARGGSKGLPGKNLRPLCGRPLVGWTTLRARESRLLDCVVLSTDSPEIAAVGRAEGVEVPFMRPAELATDTAASLSVVDHALEFYSRERGQQFDYIVLLEPTCPLRREDDIDGMLAQLIDHADFFDSIISIGKVVQLHPAGVKRRDGYRLVPFMPELPQNLRRQDYEPAYYPFGAIYIVSTPAYQRERTFYTARCTYFELERYQCYDIDDLYDFMCVEAVMKHVWGM